MSIDYLPDEMNYERSAHLWGGTKADAFDAGWRAACEAMHKKAQAKAPPGHIIDDQGNVRKVLGTLPVTRDGCVIGDDCKIFIHDEYVNSEVFRSPRGKVERDWMPYMPHKAFSTRAAAEAARGT